MKLIRGQTPLLAGQSAEEAHDEDRCEDEEVVYPLVDDHSHSCENEKEEEEDIRHQNPLGRSVLQQVLNKHNRGTQIKPLFSSRKVF